ncbi:MAG: hypothetical protein SPK52_02185 [Synergistales bacterium]|nr:hypothetical protein [Bacteroidales bacterium]MDY6393427.1 hypothetical protein [Bacteroidales bacterium]MDY6402872.1 hypothetical protein [Bacteroidales bacterium]MDY6423505.1 hypothetical protein [Bacteroidales bacterium]MDY6435006.1 hypothetical protein [Synergistales bacterium]
MMINWLRYILQAIPVRLRKSVKLFTLIWCLTAWTRERWKEEKEYVDGLITELRYTSSVIMIKELIENHFNISVEIVNSGEVMISYVYQRDDNRRAIAGYNLMAIPMQETDIGYDFKIRVPVGIDKEAVYRFVSRYVFLGLRYEIIN